MTLYKDMRAEFDSSANRHDGLYNRIASDMAHFNIKVDGPQCRDRMDELKKRFRTEYDNTRNTGTAPSTWPFFKQMLYMFKDSVTLEAPVSFSIGTTMQHLQKGAAAPQPLETGSRTRPVVAQPKSTRIRASAQKQKETSQQQQTNAIANELRLTREAMERRSDERWKDFLNVVQNQSVPFGATSRDRNFTM